jgi:hypothetical protein
MSACPYLHKSKAAGLIVVKYVEVLIEICGHILVFFM